MLSLSNHLAALVLMIGTGLAGCDDDIGDCMAASSISKHGLARNGKALHATDGQAVVLWGLVDHGNLYGDAEAREILGEWWSGEGPDPETWRFNLMAKATDLPGHSFPVSLPNDQGRDALLSEFVADARAGRPTKVLLTGRLFTFDAPTNALRLTGLSMVLRSSDAVRVGLDCATR